MPPPKYNPYQVLGLEPGASAEAIKKRYRAIALKLHPDRGPKGPKSVEMFEAATEAYRFLMDPDKKQEFDREWQRSQKKIYNLKHSAVRKLRKRQKGGVYSRKNISDEDYNEFIDECKENFLEFLSKLEKL